LMASLLIKPNCCTSLVVTKNKNKDSVVVPVVNWKDR